MWMVDASLFFDTMWMEKLSRFLESVMPKRKQDFLGYVVLRIILG